MTFDLPNRSGSIWHNLWTLPNVNKLGLSFNSFVSILSQSYSYHALLIKRVMQAEPYRVNCLINKLYKGWETLIWLTNMSYLYRPIRLNTHKLRWYELNTWTWIINPTFKWELSMSFWLIHSILFLFILIFVPNSFLLWQRRKGKEKKKKKLARKRFK